MIKVGLSQNVPDVVNILRLLQKHPDVELAWIYNFGRTAPVTTFYPDLWGETDLHYTDKPDLNDLDLYIGPYTGDQDIFTANPSLKAIFADEGILPAAIGDVTIESGIPEYNRKALVRGARATVIPDDITYLGALALMPLAKNLLLGSPINGSLLLGDTTGDKPEIAAWGKYLGEFATESLRHGVLVGLQTSFNQPLRLTAFSHGGPVSMGTFVIDTRMNIDDIRALYHSFYDDHHHVVILPETSPSLQASMVRGTNKAAVHLDVDDGRLFISVAFDSTYKLGSAIFIHLLNLLFGLDERTGL